MKISRVLVTVAALLCAGAAQAQVNDQAGLNACWQDYGTDEASIAANFGESQLCNFQNNSNLDATISGIPSPTLAMIVNQINATSGANPGVAYSAMVNLIVRLSTPNLIRLAQATVPVGVNPGDPNHSQVAGLVSQLASWGWANLNMLQFQEQIGTAANGDAEVGVAQKMNSTNNDAGIWQSLAMATSRLYANLLTVGNTPITAETLETLPAMKFATAGWAIGYGIKTPFTEDSRFGIGPAIVYVAQTLDPKFQQQLGDLAEAPVQTLTSWFGSYIQQLSFSLPFPIPTTGPASLLNLLGQVPYVYIPQGTVTIGPITACDGNYGC